jgi:hypothetical protein
MWYNLIETYLQYSVGYPILQRMLTFLPGSTVNSLGVTSIRVVAAKRKEIKLTETQSKRRQGEIHKILQNQVRNTRINEYEMLS